MMRSMKGCRAAVLLVLALGLAAPPSGAVADEQGCSGGDPSAGSGPVVICGTTTIETTTTGRVRVRVPTDATLELNPPPVITGQGRIVGFLFTEPGTQDGLWARAIRYPSALGFGASTKVEGRRAEDDREPNVPPPQIPASAIACSACHVPPGDYDLYAIADASPVSITLRFSGLQGDLRLTDQDLSPAYARQIHGMRRSGSVAPLEEARSQQISCCDDVASQAIAFVQYATRTSTTTVAEASHDVCIRTAGAQECDAGRSSHTIVGTATDDGLIGWSNRLLDPGRYELSSSFEARNTAEGFTWEVDVVGLVLGIAPPDAARAPRIWDIAGDANGAGAAGVHSDTRPAVSWDPADLLLIRFATTYDAVPVGSDGIHYEPTGVAVRFKTLATPDVFVQDFGIHYRLVTTIAGCSSELLGTIYRDQATGELKPTAYWDQFDESCPDGKIWGIAAGRRPGFTATIDPAKRELRLVYPFSAMTSSQAGFMKVGNRLVAPRAETRSPYLSVYDGATDTRIDAHPLLDATATGSDFVIGSDVPQDVPCTKGCP